MFKSVDGLYKYWFPILIYTNIESYTNSHYIISENWTAKQYQGSNDLGKLDLKSDVNQPASGKLRQSTPISSPYEQLYQPWTWYRLYFNCWYHFENWPGIVYHIKERKDYFKNRPVIVDHITCKKIHGRSLVIVIIQSKLRGWVIDIDFIIIFIRWNKKITLFAIVHWLMMAI